MRNQSFNFFKDIAGSLDVRVRTGAIKLDFSNHFSLFPHDMPLKKSGFVMCGCVSIILCGCVSIVLCGCVYLLIF